MTDIKLINEDGVIKGVDIDTGEDVPIELDESIIRGLTLADDLDADGNDITGVQSLTTERAEIGEGTEAEDDLTIRLDGTDIEWTLQTDGTLLLEGLSVSTISELNAVESFDDIPQMDAGGFVVVKDENRAYIETGD